MNFYCRRPVEGTLITGHSLYIPKGCSFFLQLTPFGDLIEASPPLKKY